MTVVIIRLKKAIPCTPTLDSAMFMRAGRRGEAPSMVWRHWYTATERAC